MPIFFVLCERVRLSLISLSSNNKMPHFPLLFLKELSNVQDLTRKEKRELLQSSRMRPIIALFLVLLFISVFIVFLGVFCLCRRRRTRGPQDEEIVIRPAINPNRFITSANLGPDTELQRLPEQSPDHRKGPAADLPPLYPGLP